MSLRTKLLLALVSVFGLGIGVLSGLSDGLYSAVCLFALPILVALTGASIMADFSQERAKATDVPIEKDQQNVQWPHAA